MYFLITRLFLVKIRFISPPPSLFYRLCFSNVFSDYKTFFSSVAFLSEMYSLGDIGWVRLG